jgi:hypothetical protein
MAGAVGPQHAEGQGGEGFFALNFSDSVSFLNVVAVDPVTRDALPLTFHADAQGNYDVAADLVLQNGSVSPIGNFHITGSETTGVDVHTTLDFPFGSGPVAGASVDHVASIIVGIETVEFNADTTGLHAHLTANSLGTAGTPPAAGLVSGNTFIDTTDGVETSVPGAGLSRSLDIPGLIEMCVDPQTIPPIPAGSTAQNYNLLVAQLDAIAFGVRSDSVFRMEVSFKLDFRPIRVLAADFDKDGDVDGDDFLVWQINVGTRSGATMMMGDADGDGDVDSDDFLIWESEFGSDAGGTVVAVPEPACMALLCVGGCAAFCRKPPRTIVRQTCRR